ncbi:phosphodiesterase/alkaline phosphatase D [Mycolicibacterium rhodesiae NBB3]|uniref:Phosphodiesterase/alkaline phosphatase D n=1 Tax=Mycolicibacterium rhodesiae (strain NBB3) TaxID=710685 RepID=G8RJS2_MYCRN|nr:alkaline phosphatase D family protein [Mycolicibacterium rhodesiae]AEV76013.1 phosphodiesterase/alkaline phosphatase D [Mycolicibacterium rhodesiae NBB3]
MTLLLGPALRHVSDTTALIWVQTESAGVVEVLGCSAPTFEVQGYHFALVEVTGLEPDSVSEYQVRFEGATVWPLADPSFAKFPPSVIRTRGPASAHRLRAIFGSCRYPKTQVKKVEKKLKHDALDSYATRMRDLPIDKWPDALILLGDQLYADELPPDEVRRVAGRRRNRNGDRPPDEVVSFAEYERLYRHSWGDPEIRWLMSTVPTAMIFDDHDIRDDWNTSKVWRAQMADLDWWHDRIRAGLASYWVYQHLGNLSPDELADNEDYQQLLAVDGDTWPHLAEVADRADREVDSNKGVRFSYRWDLGRTRLIMIDSRNGRILDSGERMMIGEKEFRWVEAKAEENPETLNHLLLASSVPWLMPPAIGDLETLNEQAAERAGWRGKLGEKLRQAGDFEHWPAFYKSLVRLGEMIARIANHPDGPATISILSGDVHHSYAARAEVDGVSPDGSTVHQLVCSPVHNYVPLFVKPAFLLGWTKPAAAVTRWWVRRSGVQSPPVAWTNVCGPLFGNTIATVEVDGRNAEVFFEQPRKTEALQEAGRVPLNRAGG